MRIQDKRSLYMDEVFGCEDSLLRALSEKAEAEGVSYMQLSPHEGRILYFLARLLKAEKAVETGSLCGYSAVCLARALPEHGKLWTLDVSEERHKALARILENHRPLQKKIRLVTGDARQTLKTIEPEGPFDMVFIDADKNSYEFYLDWAEKHLRKGGLLAADNSFLFGAVYDNEDAGGHSAETVKIMRSFNRRLAQSDLWSGALLPTEEGLTVSIKIA